MDGYCHSAADIFVGAFKGRRNVTLIGMLSSGGSGRAKRYMLANSRNQVRLASMISFRPNGMLYEGIGVHPDIYLEKTITDLIGKTDSALDKAIELLSNKISATSIQNMDFNEELGKITVDYSMSDEGLQVR